eukprot:TRINITY_DN5156_c0_g1_i1.p1 TRINITY_DN5156_c0_g1~~TRINITY_DN5156_c0_g1_i1.p1  ORF type:complete len:307 (+),score=21.23 TRINITY_DN5156_c0_g1_i1:303-1223(+)
MPSQSSVTDSGVATTPSPSPSLPSRSSPPVSDSVSNKLIPTVGNFVGCLGATGLVGFSVSMNHLMDGKPLRFNASTYNRAALFYARYVPAAVLGASALAFYGTAPLIQKYAGLDEASSNAIALGSIGPLLAPLYARQEGGITLVTLCKMTQAEALKKLNHSSRIPYVAPGTLFTVCRNTISLGVGGALAADGGEALASYTLPQSLRESNPISSKIAVNTLVGFLAGGVSGVFEFLRIAKVIAAGKGESFSVRKHMPALVKQRSLTKFALLRSTHMGLFYACFIGGQELAKQYRDPIRGVYDFVAGQ